jgi:meso-butanediol dehydrogenase / (S,S)-butanediol dehydrogenase / diacetyl reductase
MPSPAGSILITGGASGIGYAVAEEAATRGHAVVLVDRCEAALEESVARLASDGATVVGRLGDVTDLDSLTAAVTETRDQRPPLVGVASCAGIEVSGSVLDTSVDDWRRAIDVNLTGSFLTLRATLPELLANGGSAVLISSDGGVAGAQDFSAYCASKHGVIGLMRTAALDFGPRGVRVNAVAPSFVETPMADRIFAGVEEDRDFWRSTVPLGRFARPAEVADVVLHLLTDATYTNGHVYRIDGGATAGYYLPTA